MRNTSIINSREFSLFDVYMFDLDNTLYSEVDYLETAYLKIAATLKSQYSVSQNDIFLFLKQEFQFFGRNQLFNKLYNFLSAKKLEIDNERIFVDYCLSILREVQSPHKIFLYNHIYSILGYLTNNSKKIVVITNGNVEQQKNKIRLIDWMGFDEKIDFVFANLYAPKPDPKSFHEYVRGRYFLNDEQGIFIGDSASDEEFAFNIQKSFMYARNLSLLKL